MNDAPIDKTIAKKYAQAFINAFPKTIGFNDLEKDRSSTTIFANAQTNTFFLAITSI